MSDKVEKPSSFLQKVVQWQKDHPKLTLILCALIVAPYAYSKLSRWSEKQIDVRAFYFPSRSMSYELVNEKNINDKISISVQVKAMNENKISEGVIIKKKFSDVDVEETYLISEQAIFKVSHKVQGSEQMKDPVRFMRFIKTNEVFGPIADKYFDKSDVGESVRDCYRIINSEGSSKAYEVTGKKLVNIAIMDNERRYAGWESYCQDIGLTRMDDYVLNIESLKEFCNKYEFVEAHKLTKCTPSF